MANYLHFVEDLAKSSTDEFFFNSGPIHAAIVMSNIFRFSNKIVRIYTGGFNGAISNDKNYRINLEAFLSRDGSKMKILALKDYRKKETCKIFSILDKYIHKVEYKLTDSIVINKDDNTPIHFTIGDEKMTRVELNISNYIAQVNLGNHDFANKYIKTFEEIWKITN